MQRGTGGLIFGGDKKSFFIVSPVNSFVFPFVGNVRLSGALRRLFLSQMRIDEMILNCLERDNFLR